jgi:hypothetical protein
MCARLDVLSTVAEALVDADRKACLVGGDDDAVHPITASRLKLDAEQSHRHAGYDVGGERIPIAGAGIDPERPGVRRRDEAGTPYQDRGPRSAFRIEASDEEKRQLCEQLTMLIGHEVANDLAPNLLEPRAQACSFLQDALAGMKRRVLMRGARR